MLLMRYLNGRKSIKETWWNTATPEERKVANSKNTRSKTKKKPKKPIQPKVE